MYHISYIDNTSELLKWMHLVNMQYGFKINVFNTSILFSPKSHSSIPKTHYHLPLLAYRDPVGLLINCKLSLLTAFYVYKID